MLKFILTLITLIAQITTSILKRRKPAKRVEEILGEPEVPSYSEAAKKAADRAADEKYGPEQ